MKRIFTVIAIFSLFIGAVAQLAQKQMVTVSHNGDLTFFTSSTALEEALNKAENGDTIYLSEGVFTSNSSKITIDKRVSIIGCGYKSYILTPLYISMHNINSITNLTLFEGVRIFKLYTSETVTIPNNLYTTITKSWIENLGAICKIGERLTIDRCYIGTFSPVGAGYVDVYLQNSKIKEIDSSNYYGGFFDAQISNCNIGETYYAPRSAYSSIISKFTSDLYNSYNGALITSESLNSNGSHYLYACLLPSTYFHPGIESLDCYTLKPEEGLLDEDLESTVDLVEAGYLGQDGTQVGVYGGDFPYSVYPNLPTVDSENSSVEYDAENNKLNVTITVAPN